MGTFRVATYNVNSIRSRLHIVLPWLRGHRPDVFCMQETKAADDNFPVAAFAAEGYRVTFRGTKQYNGVAVASREIPGKVLYGLPDGGPADEDRLIAAVYSDATIINTYVPQGREKDTPYFAYKLEWFQRLRRFFDRFSSPDAPLIWCGDLNVAPTGLTSTIRKGCSAMSVLRRRSGTPTPPSGLGGWRIFSAVIIRRNRAVTPSSITGCRAP